MKKFIFGLMVLIISLNGNSQSIFFQRCGTDAANSANPNDNIGVEHNDALYYLASNYTIPQLQNVNTLYNAGIQYMNNTYGPNSAPNFSTNFTTSTINNYLSVLSPSAPPANSFFTNSAPISSIGKAFLSQLLNQIYNQSAANSGYPNIKSKIVTWENQISALSVTNTEKFALYAYGSTLRYSLLAWSTNNTFTSSINFNSQNKKLKWWQWLCVGLMDAGGAIAGATLGGGVGAVVGGAVMSGGTVAVFSTFEP